MDTAKLETARRTLEDAVETANDDLRDELEEVATEFGALESPDEPVDHAVLDSHLNTLRQLKEHARGETEPAIGRALEHAEAYRAEIDQA